MVVACYVLPTLGNQRFLLGDQSRQKLNRFIGLYRNEKYFPLVYEIPTMDASILVLRVKVEQVANLHG
jgi:hypothetical protein